ncbi:MAG: hypothetical protein OXE92_04295 [Bacteroidetes bacterium]|nr:hypothetical protein [Bacteroidota bacterium]MCY4204930.1 hypothetical protein [Bacteroidota bacterium]
MRTLIEDLLPHAPKIGLYVAPGIPSKRLRGATRDYAKDAHPEDILALYDGTFLGNGRDGIVFLEDRLIFQNSDLEPSQTVHYRDIVFVESSRSRLRGTHIAMEVNRGRATFSVKLDLSKHPDSLEFIEKLLSKVMLLPDSTESKETDWSAVSKALESLRSSGSLTESDYQRLMSFRS